jgi:hypothetical protein
MKTQKLKIVEGRTGPKSLAHGYQPALAPDPEAERIVARIVGTSAAPRLTSAPGAFDSTTGVLPEWGRWRDVQRLFGIKRGTLYNLKAERKVRSSRVLGCRLFDLASVRAHVLAQIQ